MPREDLSSVGTHCLQQGNQLPQGLCSANGCLGSSVSLLTAMNIFKERGVNVSFTLAVGIQFPGYEASRQEAVLL